jgi:acyl-coenzyme A synthetase/AMP-(fatty) acid ligase
MNKFQLKKGDCVALFLENKPEYVATWIGLSKIGVISALINTNLQNQPLLHSIQLAKPKIVLYGSSLENCKLHELLNTF